MLQFLLSGVAIGAIYGLIGMALAITFYVTRIINFAQGQMMMATIMVTAELSATGYPTWLAAIAGLASACLLGVLSYLIAVRPILAINRFSFGWLVSTLGFAVIVENGAAYIWGPTSQAFPPMLKQTSFHLFGAVLTAQQLLAIVTAAVFTAGFELVRRNTLFGKIGMATAADPGNGDRHRRQHDRRRDRRLRGFGRVRRRRWPPDRPDDFRQSLSRRHLRHVRLHRHDDRRGHGKTDLPPCSAAFSLASAPRAPMR